MLVYEPEHRATAQDMLNNPWLTMEANFDYKMSDRDHEKMTMFKKNIKAEKKQTNEKDVLDSDIERNHADDEDNDALSNENDDDSLCMEPTDVINIQNFNNSFAIYGQHVKLSALDKANPQFK